MSKKIPLRQRWGLFVKRYSKWRALPYCSLWVTLMLVILQFTRYAHLHFLLLMALFTILLFERLAFSELLSARDLEIERLRSNPALGKCLPK
jgi:hypothetical protein